jgi:membrane-associated protein
MLRDLIDLFLHLDQHLGELVRNYGVWTYAILTLVVFLETGVVITPFLPGDSLLFAAGAIAATGGLNVWILFALLASAAVVGDTLNYWIGNRIGHRAFSGNIRFLKREHLVRTHAFYERHGGKTIFLARFLPIIRTFAPFVAGIGEMSYPRFLAWNVGGGVVWVALFLFAGYGFGNVPVVKENFSLVILAIIFLSVVPIAYEFLKQRLAARRVGT